MDYVSVLPLLSVVTINGEVKATVIAATVFPAYRGGFAVRYECEWWDGRTIQTHAFDSDLVKPLADNPQLRIGFNKDAAP